MVWKVFELFKRKKTENNCKQIENNRRLRQLEIYNSKRRRAAVSQSFTRSQAFECKEKVNNQASTF